MWRAPPSSAQRGRRAAARARYARFCPVPEQPRAGRFLGQGVGQSDLHSGHGRAPCSFTRCSSVLRSAENVQLLPMLARIVPTVRWKARRCRPGPSGATELHSLPGRRACADAMRRSVLRAESPVLAGSRTRLRRDERCREAMREGLRLHGELGNTIKQYIQLRVSRV